jgi:acetyltransferase-like isoleucine patch superfamily enzyme
VKALGELGVARLARFAWTATLLCFFRHVPTPPLRRFFLLMCGARVGANTIVHRITLSNVDRGGFKALTIGANCFIGEEVLIDLAASVLLEDEVTLAARAMILTHLNVGYRDHPLQARFPSHAAPVTIRRGSFVGAGATVLAGCSIGPEAFVGAASLVNRDLDPAEAVAGVPIRALAASTGPQRPSASSS